MKGLKDMGNFRGRLNALERRVQAGDRAARLVVLTLDEYAAYQRTGVLPPPRDGFPPPPLVLLFSDTMKPVTYLNMELDEL